MLLALACRDIASPPQAVDQARANLLINPAGRVTVYPANMHGWMFYNDQTSAACSDTNACKMVSGPGSPPSAGGSAELADSLTTDGKALILVDYTGTRFDQLTTLRYSTYRQSADAGNNLAISLQFNADYDLGDAGAGYQGRLVFEPYFTNGGSVVQSTWQEWDAKAGKWWGTRSTVTKNNIVVANPCVQATPCTWAQLLASFPNVGIHSVYGAVVLKAGSGWSGFRGNVDKLSIGVGGVTTTFDFELGAPAVVPATAPEGIPDSAYADTLPATALYPQTIMREGVIVVFRSSATQAQRQAAIDAVSGTVVGGLQYSGDGLYLVRVPSDSTAGPLLDALETLEAMPQVRMASLDGVMYDATTYRRPKDGTGMQRADWRLNADSAFGDGNRKTWAFEAINAPWAWGCSTGGNTKVAIMDMGVHVYSDVSANVDTVYRSFPQHTLPGMKDGFEHGAQIASAIAARGNNGTDVTGMMWDAKLMMNDVSQVGPDGTPIVSGKNTVSWDHEIQKSMTVAANNGPRVINISLGSNSLLSPLPTATALANERVAWSKRAALAREVAVDNGRPAPLWVISASNMGSSADVKYAYPTGIQDSLPNEVLIVTGASVNKGNLLPNKNGANGATGQGNITIAAPGEQVTVVDQTVHQVDGSSIATALVSGAAGLMFSFDSTLTAAEVRTMLVQAATASGRTAGGFPFLDAYGALRIAAKRRMAPLCGNRAWVEPDRGVVVQRDSTGGANDTETIAGDSTTTPFDPWSFNYMNIHHGGKRMELDWSTRYEWTAGSGWALGDWGGDDISDYSGTWKGTSAYYQDHDDSLSSHFKTTRSGQAFTLKAEFSSLPSYTVFSTFTQSSAATLTGSATESCSVMRARDSSGTFLGYDCVATDSTGTWEFPNWTENNVLHALDPQGRFAIVALGVDTRYRALGPLDPCPGHEFENHPPLCAPRITDSLRTTRVHIWKVDRAGTWTELSVPSITADSAEVFGLAINEQGTELMLQVGKHRINSVAETETCSNARHEWIALAGSGFTAGSTKFRRNISAVDLCSGAYDGGANGAARKGRRAGISGGRRP